MILAQYKSMNESVATYKPLVVIYPSVGQWINESWWTLGNILSGDYEFDRERVERYLLLGKARKWFSDIPYFFKRDIHVA